MILAGLALPPVTGFAVRSWVNHRGLLVVEPGQATWAIIVIALLAAFGLAAVLVCIGIQHCRRCQPNE